MRTQSTEAELAASQHGLVTRRQLREAGLSTSAIMRRVEGGLLIPVHRGVYRVGHAAKSIEAIYLAAVLAGGDGAVLSGRAAGYLHRLLRGSPPPPQITTQTKRRVPGVRCRQSVIAPDATRVEGIPVTSVAWTLVDIAKELGEVEMGWAAHQAHSRFRVGAPQVVDVLSRRPNAPGARRIRQVVLGDAATILSRMEGVFQGHVRRERFPQPETNRPAGGRYVDCRWPAHRLTVELDSYGFHASRYAWEQDRKREREAYARGDDFRRYTYGDVCEHPEPMLRELRSLLLPSLF